MALLLVLSLAGWLALMQQRLRLQADQAILVGVSAMMLALYGFGYFGALGAGKYAILGLGLACWLPLAMDWRRGSLSSRALAGMFVPNLALLLVFAVVLAWLLRDTFFWTWDSFTHWGLVPKLFTDIDSLGLASSPHVFKSYPPAVGLFISFFTTLLGWSELTATWASDMVLASALAAMLLPTRTRLAWLANLAIVAAFLLLNFNLGHGLNAVLIDHLISAWWAAGLAVYWKHRPQRLAELWYFIPFVAALTLFKAAGMLFALAFVAVVLVDRLMQRRSATTPATPRSRIAGVAVLVALVAAAPLASASWNRYLETNGIEQSAKQNVSAAASVSFVDLIGRVARRQDLAEYQLASRDAFIQALRSRPLWGVLAADALFAIVLFVPLLAWPLVGGGASGFGRLLAWQAVLAIFALAYIGGTMVSYLLTFSVAEATALASYERYLNVFFFGWAIALVVAIMHSSVATGRTRASVAAAVVLVAAVALLPREPGRWRVRADADPGVSKLRAPIDAYAARLREVLPGDARIWVSFQGTNGLQYFMARYSLLPMATSGFCWSMAHAPPPEDAYTCNVDDMAETPADYDYMFAPDGFAALQAALPEHFADATWPQAWILEIVKAPDGDWRLAAPALKSLRDPRQATPP